MAAAYRSLLRFVRGEGDMASSGIVVQDTSDQPRGDQRGADAGTRAEDHSDVRVMSMLEEHVPLALLCDLGAADGPTSAEILAEEGAPETEWWRQ